MVFYTFLKNSNLNDINKKKLKRENILRKSGKICRRKPSRAVKKLLLLIFCISFVLLLNKLSFGIFCFIFGFIVFNILFGSIGYRKPKGKTVKAKASFRSVA
jgi:hypothetical protein